MSILVAFFFLVNQGLASVSIDSIGITDSTPEIGSQVELHCAIASSGNDTTIEHVYWSKDGRNLTRDEGEISAEEYIDRAFVIYNQTSSLTTTSRFTITSVALQDSGVYTCTVLAFEMRGNMTYDMTSSSSSVDLDVLYFPDIRYPKCLPGKETRVRIGEPITLSCVAQKGNPPVMLAWSRQESSLSTADGETADLHSRMQTRSDGLVEATFELIPSISDQNAIYACQMSTSPDFTNETQYCTVTTMLIFPSPVVSVHPDKDTVYYHQTVEYTCQTSPSLASASDDDADDAGGMRWYLDPPIDNSRVTFPADNDSNNRLVISNVSAGDNMTLISCIVLVDGRFYEATSTLLVSSPDTNVLDATTTTPFFTDTSIPTTQDIGDDGSSAFSSSHVLVIISLFVLMMIVFGVAFLYIRRRKKKLMSQQTAHDEDLRNAVIPAAAHGETLSSMGYQLDASLRQIQVGTQTDEHADPEYLALNKATSAYLPPDAATDQREHQHYHSSSPGFFEAEMGPDDVFRNDALLPREVFEDIIVVEEVPMARFDNGGFIYNNEGGLLPPIEEHDSTMEKRVRFAEKVDTISQDSLYLEVKQFLY